MLSKISASSLGQPNALAERTSDSVLCALLCMDNYSSSLDSIMVGVQERAKNRVKGTNKHSYVACLTASVQNLFQCLYHEKLREAS
jgi:hypothetical protein